MWILLSSIILLIIFSVWFMVRSEFTKKKKNHNLNYWQFYQILIYEIESLSMKLNQIGIHLMQSPPNNPAVLDRYESAMKLFETLLTAITKLNPDGKDLGSLKSASYLVEQCKSNLESFDKKPQHPHSSLSANNKDFVYSNFPAPQTKNPFHGKACYFCSRPGSESSPNATGLVQVRVKVDSSFQTVVSCSICEEILKKTKKVKVLFFVKDGKPTHWSDLKEYIPNQDFWKLNQTDDGTIKRPPKLELVYSRPNSEHEI